MPNTLPILHHNNSHVLTTPFQPITYQEISHAISQLKSSVSQTPDLIPSLYIKKTALNLLRPLHILFNYSVSSGEIPSIWKKGIIVPIYKKGKTNDPKNYRPISLTSVVCRLLEKIIHKYIAFHIMNNNIISEAQHGFISGRSTQTQQLNFLNTLTQTFDNKIQMDIIYLDFSKAFDKVSHCKLMYVLNSLKIDFKITNWISNYLSGRTQTTVVEESFSNIVSVTSGVPQGSVLGPLLFVIFIQGLIEAINKKCKETTVYAFADDIKLLSTNKQNLQQALTIVDKWVDEWALQLNRDISEHFTIRQTICHTFYMNNKSVPKVTSVRDLGITISDNLSWKQYINKIRAKANILSNTILRTFSPNNTTLIVNLFKTYVRPIVEYHTCSWSPYQQSDITDIESIQRAFTRKLCQRANISFCSYNDRLEKLKLETLQCRRVKRDLVYIFKILHQYVDVSFTDHFQFSNFNGHFLRRHNLHLVRPTPAKTLVRDNFYATRAVKHWNNLPEDIVNSQTLSVFKSRLKRHTCE